MGQGLPFRAGSFDGAISISALQWLCNADKKSNNPKANPSIRQDIDWKDYHP